MLVPCGEPKPEPIIFTTVFTGPLFGFSGGVMLGGTVKVMPLLAAPFAFTTTGPVHAPTGTVVVMSPSLQFAPVTVARVLLKDTVPGAEPKPLPLMVTDDPSGPELPEVPTTLVMAGGAITVKPTRLLLTPSTITATFTLPGVTPDGMTALRRTPPTWLTCVA